MELHWIWQTMLIFFVGTFILRVAGRKSISQMTISQTVVMIGLGSLLIQPVTGNGLFITLLVAALFSLLMIVTEFLELKIDFLENLFAGKAVIVIDNGNINTRNLRKLRLSVDRLETRLRQAGIVSIEDVKYATLEVSGQLGYELKDNKKPITKEEFNVLMGEIAQIKEVMGIALNNQRNSNNSNNIFQEIKNNKFEGNKREP